MRWTAAIMALLAMLSAGAAPAPARMAIPPKLVGPPALALGVCPVELATPGGAGIGAEIPFPALRLGAPVARNPLSFATGGGGTANATERWRRQQAGLQYDPATFDPGASAMPSVFAVEASQVPAPSIYQRLPVKTLPVEGMIFAQAVSPTRGRIASLALMLDNKPSARPRLTITGARPMLAGCQRDNPIHVYAPAMTAPQLRRLFSPSGCGWNRLADCTRAERPKGRVLFVQKQQGANRYEYRWVDYDLLAPRS